MAPTSPVGSCFWGFAKALRGHEIMLHSFQEKPDGLQGKAGPMAPTGQAQSQADLFARPLPVSPTLVKPPAHPQKCPVQLSP